MNSCNFKGNVGKDPEIKPNENGVDIAKFSMAVSKPDFRNKGEYITTWVNVKVVGKNAEICRDIKKGDKVAIVGAEYCCDKWKNDTGDHEYHYFLVIGFNGCVGITRFKKEQQEEYR